MRLLIGLLFGLLLGGLVAILIAAQRAASEEKDGEGFALNERNSPAGGV